MMQRILNKIKSLWWYRTRYFRRLRTITRVSWKKVVLAIALIFILIFARKLVFSSLELILSIAIWVIPIVLIFKFRKVIWVILKIIFYILVFVGVLALASILLGFEPASEAARGIQYILAGISLFVAGYMILKFFNKVL